MEEAVVSDLCEARTIDIDDEQLEGARHIVREDNPLSVRGKIGKNTANSSFADGRLVTWNKSVP